MWLAARLLYAGTGTTKRYTDEVLEFHLTIVWQLPILTPFNEGIMQGLSEHILLMVLFMERILIISLEWRTSFSDFNPLSIFGMYWERP